MGRNIQFFYAHPQFLRMRLSLQEDNPKKDSKEVHKLRAVQHYRSLSEQLSLKLFQFVAKNKKETEILIHSKYLTNGKENKGPHSFVCRSVRREALGLQQADIENYRNKSLGKMGSVVKRKNVSVQRRRNFEVSEHVRGKFNIKGFAAKIDHNLGRRKAGINGLTRMINTQLIKH